VIKAGLDFNSRKAGSGCHLKIEIVITDNQLGIMVDNPKV